MVRYHHDMGGAGGRAQKAPSGEYFHPRASLPLRAIDIRRQHSPGCRRHGPLGRTMMNRSFGRPAKPGENVASSGLLVRNGDSAECPYARHACDTLGKPDPGASHLHRGPDDRRCTGRGSEDVSGRAASFPRRTSGLLYYCYIRNDRMLAAMLPCGQVVTQSRGSRR
jgi:hypothetical protein